MEKGKAKRRLRNENHNILSPQDIVCVAGVVSCHSGVAVSMMSGVLFRRRTDDRERQSERLEWRWKTADVHLRPEFSLLQTIPPSPCLDCSISTSSAQTIHHRSAVVRRNITRVPIHRSRCKPDASAATLNNTATILYRKQSTPSDSYLTVSSLPFGTEIPEPQTAARPRPFKLTELAKA